MHLQLQVWLVVCQCLSWMSRPQQRDAGNTRTTGTYRMGAESPELNSDGMFDQRCWRMYKLRLRQQLLRHCHWSVTVHLLDLKPICKFELHGLVV